MRSLQQQQEHLLLQQEQPLLVEHYHLRLRIDVLSECLDPEDTFVGPIS